VNRFGARMRVIGFCCCLASYAAHGAELTVYPSSLPDYMITTGPTLAQSSGMMMEIAAAAFGAAHLRVELAPSSPWPRAQALAIHQPGAILLVLAQSPQRFPDWRWLSVVYTDTLYGFTLRGRARYSSLAQIKQSKPRVAAKLGAAAVSLMQTMGIAVDASPASDDNFMKLVTGKADVLLMQGMAVYPALQSLRQGPHQVLFSQWIPTFQLTPVMAIPLWVVTSLATPPAEAQKIADALDRFKTTAQYRAIVKKYQARFERATH